MFVDPEHADRFESYVVKNFVPKVTQEIPQKLYEDYPSLTVVTMETAYEFWMDKPMGNLQLDKRIANHYIRQWRDRDAFSDPLKFWKKRVFGAQNLFL